MVAWWPVVTRSVSTEAQKQKPGSVSPKERYILRGWWGFAPILRAQELLMAPKSVLICHRPLKLPGSAGYTYKALGYLGWHSSLDLLRRLLSL